MSFIQELNERFGIHGVAEVIADRAGMPAVWIEGNPGTGHGATGAVYLHGAHVAAWRPRGDADVLWLSQKSLWQADKPIRGGVPVCFPWFGPNKDNAQAPAHGFARLRPWTLESLQRTAAGITVSLALRSDAATRALWPHDFLLRHRIIFGDELQMDLELTNSGKTAFTAEQAQHTYFSVGDVRQTRIIGLGGGQYIDKVDALRIKTQAGEIAITGETDRVYFDRPSPPSHPSHPPGGMPIVIEDAVKRRVITIAQQNAANTVVWNPWIDKAKAMADFGDDEWPEMLCVETCNVGKDAVTLAAGTSHTMSTRISVRHL